jgi:peptidoglycan-associated lipoprotein
MFPTIRGNGILYFSSNAHIGMGGLDIFMAQKNADGKWIVENMKSPINSTGDDFAINFYAGEERGLFTSNREGSLKDDIYTFVLPPKVYEIEGDVINKENGIRISDASVKLIGTDGTMLKLKAENGQFRFKLKPQVEYIVAAYRKGFLNAKAVASTMGLEEGKQFELRLELTPADSPISIDNIYYAFSKWDLLPESVAALDSLSELLVLNPTTVIELMAHTDCRGDDALNSEISQKRAQSVVTYLIAKGIQPGRLVAKGYGETAPKKITKKIAKTYPFLKPGTELTCKFIESLADEKEREICHQINRRTEFKVLSSDYREKFDK